MGLIYFFEEIFGKIVFSIGEYEFEGIRPVRYEELPWETHEGMNKYMNELEKENTPYSYKKFIFLEEKRLCQRMHINFSRSFLFLVAAIILLTASGLLLFSENKSASLIMLAVSVILFAISLLLRLRVSKIYRSIGLSKIIYGQFETWPE